MTSKMIIYRSAYIVQLPFVEGELPYIQSTLFAGKLDLAFVSSHSGFQNAQSPPLCGSTIFSRAT